MYRDVRIDNTACCVSEPRRWYLIDLDCCAREGNIAPPLLKNSHVTDVLVHGCFTAASDLALLGRLLKERGADEHVTSAAGRDFITSISMPAQQQQKTSQDMLKHVWLCCAGQFCDVVGAKCGER